MEWNDWEGVFLCGWETLRGGGGGVSTEKERENPQSFGSSLWWGHPAEVHSWGSQRAGKQEEGNKLDQKRSEGEVVASFKSALDHVWLPLTSVWLARSSHTLLRLPRTLQPHNRLCCSVRSKGFHWVRQAHRDRNGELKTNWGNKKLGSENEVISCSVSVWVSFRCSLSVLVVWTSPSRSYKVNSVLCLWLCCVWMFWKPLLFSKNLSAYMFYVSQTDKEALVLCFLVSRAVFLHVPVDTRPTTRCPWKKQMTQTCFGETKLSVLLNFCVFVGFFLVFWGNSFSESEG